jgi:GPH family glycoside/pentoside/hexuronide:cation symporter
MTDWPRTQTVAAAANGGQPSPVLTGLCYGALGAPLAFAALPLYVLLPNHYAAQLGVPLAGLGAVLLATRAADAVVDPWLGRRVDAVLRRPQRRQPHHLALLAWCAGALVLTSLGYSALGVLHQAWGARLGGGSAAQARIVGWREGLSLAGVLLASVLPGLAGIPVMVGTCLVLLAMGIAALGRAPFKPAGPQLLRAEPPRAWALPWRVPAFRKLIAVFLLNGVASAVPATLVLFFVRDRLQAPAFEPLFLGGYFAAGALSMPLWVKAVARVGLVRCWLAGMGLAIASFVWAARLGVGDVAAFAAVCLASGAALGADLAVPGALLAGVVQRAQHAQRHEGLYFGWWNCATKLNLALAAGLSLPALQWLGYAPGSRSPAALDALAIAYAALPCLLKLAAATLLWTHRFALDPRS